MMKQVFAAVAAVGLCLITAACGGDSESKDERVKADSVVQTCDPESTYLTLTDDEKAIDFNFKPGTEEPETVYKCLLKESGAPSSVDYKVMETRPVDGTQSASWDGWEMNWNYEGKYEGTTIHLSEV